MLRLVLDTNVWLDWLVFDDPGIKALQVAVDAGEAEVVINADCEAELLRVLAYPLQKWTLDAGQQINCIDRCRAVSRTVETPCTITLPACADSDDQKFLELAAGTGAHYLLSRDQALLALARHRPPLPFHIVTPDEFTTRLGVESADGTMPRAD
ncbi:MAG: putative toxin-antitoxin system toxin component, PIN family [Betaproteobacteria bacterium]